MRSEDEEEKMEATGRSGIDSITTGLESTMAAATTAAMGIVMMDRASSTAAMTTMDGDDAPNDDCIVQNTGLWTEQEHNKFLQGVEKYKNKWTKVAAYVQTRTPVQTRTHAKKFFKKVSHVALKATGSPLPSKSTATMKPMSIPSPFLAQQHAATSTTMGAKKLPASATTTAAGMTMMDGDDNSDDDCVIPMEDESTGRWTEQEHHESGIGEYTTGPESTMAASPAAAMAMMDGDDNSNDNCAVSTEDESTGRWTEQERHESCIGSKTTGPESTMAAATTTAMGIMMMDPASSTAAMTTMDGDDAPNDDCIVQNTGLWTEQEHNKFLQGLEKYKNKWTKVAAYVQTRTPVQTRTHAKKFFKKVSHVALKATGSPLPSKSTATMKPMSIPSPFLVQQHAATSTTMGAKKLPASATTTAAASSAFVHGNSETLVVAPELAIVNVLEGEYGVTCCRPHNDSACLKKCLQQERFSEDCVLHHIKSLVRTIAPVKQPTDATQHHRHQQPFPFDELVCDATNSATTMTNDGIENEDMIAGHTYTTGKGMMSKVTTAISTGNLLTFKPQTFTTTSRPHKERTNDENKENIPIESLSEKKKIENLQFRLQSHCKLAGADIAMEINDSIAEKNDDDDNDDIAMKVDVPEEPFDTKRKKYGISTATATTAAATGSATPSNVPSTRTVHVIVGNFAAVKIPVGLAPENNNATAVDPVVHPIVDLMELFEYIDRSFRTTILFDKHKREKNNEENAKANQIAYMKDANNFWKNLLPHYDRHTLSAIRGKVMTNTRRADDQRDRELKHQGINTANVDDNAEQNAMVCPLEESIPIVINRVVDKTMDIDDGKIEIGDDEELCVDDVDDIESIVNAECPHKKCNGSDCSDFFNEHDDYL